MPPHVLPAHSWATRIQQELFSSCLAGAVPVKLHLHPSVLVSEDFLARLADDYCGLRALHDRLARAALGTERRSCIDRLDGDGKLLAAGGWPPVS